MLLHVITTNGKSYQWRKNQHKAFDEMKQRISQAPSLALPNFHNLFNMESDGWKWILYGSGRDVER